MMPAFTRDGGRMGRVFKLVWLPLGAFGLVATAALGQTAAPAAQGEDQRRIANALAALKPQRPGTVDAYVIVAALDTDPVFGREAREAGRVLARRFDAEGRTIVLAEDEAGDKAAAAGTPHHLALALGGAAAVMDRKEDVLVLYTTSHGIPRAGLQHKNAVGEVGIVAPAELAAMLARHGFENQLIVLQACYSGQFIPLLASPRTIIATAASAMRPSFGCTPGNDWTFFGHALINQAMRRPDSFARQFRRAFVTIYQWERRLGIEPSSPQISIGSETAGWLAALDARAPEGASTPVGRPPSELAQ
jgi:peptidase C13-like protein